MLRNIWHKCLAYSAAGLTALALGQSLTAQEIRPRSPFLGLPEPTRDLVVFLNDESAAEPSEESDKESERSEYWLGLGLDAYLPDLVKQQFGLEHGLIVSDVAEDSPAAKAEMKKFDILVKADDTPLKEPADLIKSVENSKGKALKIILFRKGKEAAVQVTPAKRPASEAQRYRLRMPSGKFDAEIKNLEQALDKLKGKAGNDSLGLFFARPGVMSPSINVFKRNELPKNMSISITKEGNKPAKIHVKKDEQEWDVTDDKLGDLPEEVRLHVQQFLARPMQLSMDFKGPGPDVKWIGPKADSKTEGSRGAGTQSNTNRSFNYRFESGGLDSKLDSIMKKLDQLTKEVDELKSGKK